MLQPGWRAAPMLRLTRVTSAFAAVANVWFVALWTRAFPQEPGPPLSPALPAWLQLLAAAVTGVALYAFAAVLNDILDFRRDRALHPERPLPSGELSLESAAYLCAATLITAFLAATALGLPAAGLTAFTAGAILAYNVFARHLPAIGLVTLALTYAVHMLIPNPWLTFVWPVWLVMTHSLVVAAVAHRIAGRRPPLTRGGAALIALGWAIWSIALLALGWERSGSLWPTWVPLSSAAPPLALAALFALFAWRRVKTSRGGERAADRITRYGGLWLALYHAGWFVGVGKRDEAAILGALTLFGFIGMIALREMRGIIEQPLTYRR